MSSKQKAYFGLDRIISIILAIIPFTNVLCGIITRVMRGNILGAVLNFFLAPVFWIIDLITMLTQGDVTVLAQMPCRKNAFVPECNSFCNLFCIFN